MTNYRFEYWANFCVWCKGLSLAEIEQVVGESFGTILYWSAIDQVPIEAAERVREFILTREKRK